MHLTSTRPRLRTHSKAQFRPVKSDSNTSSASEPKRSLGDSVKDFVEKRPGRAIATALALGVALPVTLGAEFGLGYQGIGSVMTVAALASLFKGSSDIARGFLKDPENVGPLTRRGFGNMLAGASIAMVPPGGSPLAAAGLLLGTALATY